MAGTVTLIGSGEFSPGMVAVHRRVLGRLSQPRAAFLDTPAGFQANADELSQAAREFFSRELGLSLAVASLRHSKAPAAQIQLAKTQLEAADVILAGPGSPTYAIRHWRASSLAQTLAERLAVGAHLVFASSAAIAISRRALPIYEIYKVGDDPYWADGLNLLRAHGFDLAIVPHWNNREPRCFMGIARFEALAAQLGPETVILGIDEDTAVTLHLDARSAQVAGAGAVTLQFKGEARVYPSGVRFELDRLTPAGALSAPPAAPVAAPESSRSMPVERAPGPLYVPEAVRAWANERDRLRAEKKFAEADRLRERIGAVGYALKDSPAGPLFTLTQYSNSNAIPSQLDKPDAVEWSVVLLAGQGHSPDEITRSARSALEHGAGHSLEVVIVADASDEAAAQSLADFACHDDRIKMIWLAGPFGAGAGLNAGLRAARGAFVMILGGHVEIAGDVFTPLAATLADEGLGATGSNPLVSADLFSFSPAPTPEADAIEFYLFAFRRARLERVGWLDEKFVFYRNLDLDWSLAFKDKGLRLAATPGLPLVVHEHPYLRMDPVERDKLSKKNYRRFLQKWRDRHDLLVSYRRAR